MLEWAGGGRGAWTYTAGGGGYPLDPPRPDQSDHRGKNRNLQQGKRCRVIFGTQISGSTPIPPLLILPCGGGGGGLWRGSGQPLACALCADRCHGFLPCCLVSKDWLGLAPAAGVCMFAILPSPCVVCCPVPTLFMRTLARPSIRHCGFAGGAPARSPCPSAGVSTRSHVTIQCSASLCTSPQRVLVKDSSAEGPAPHSIVSRT